MWKLEWNEGRKKVSSLIELEHMLDILHDKSRTHPVLVSVEGPGNIGSVGIGLGFRASVLNFIPASGDPPYFTSVGKARTKGKYITFDFMGEQSEFPFRNAIPYPLARKGLRYFCETGELFDKIKWEQD